MNATLLAQGMKAIGGLQDNAGYGQTLVGTQREQAVVDKMASTANRLENIESTIGNIHNWLYGPEPMNTSESYGSEPNVLSQANRAHYSVERIERMLDDICRRLASND